MKNKMLILLVASVILTTSGEIQNVNAQNSVTLTVDAGSADVNNYMVSTGVPFPRGAVTSLNNLRLENLGGVEIPAQFEGLVQWPDSSYKSILVHFASDISTNLTTDYVLQYGSGVSHSTYSEGLSYVDNGSSILVDTGAIQFELNKSAFTVFDQVWVDNNADGFYDDSEKMMSQPGKIFLINAFDNLEYSSSLFTQPVYTIEESGPIRMTVKVEGKLQTDNGSTLTDFIVWLYAYAGQGQIQMDYTLVDTRLEKDVAASRSQLALSVTGYGLKLPLNLSNAMYAFGGENNQTLTGPVSGNHYLYQHGDMNYIDGGLQPFDFGYEGAGSGAKAPGWMDVSSNNTGSGVGVMIKDFWQQYPKEFAIENNALIAYLHPTRASSPTPDLSYPPHDAVNKKYKRPNTFYFSREGGAKTYQILFDFHNQSKSIADISNHNKVFQAHYPLVTAPATWYAQSKVFGDMVEAGPWSAGYDDNLISGYYKRSIEDKKDTGGITVMYGWRDFGDRMRAGWDGTSSNGVRIPAFYNDTHVGAHQYFIQYLRTKDKRWWELAEKASRHWMDVDVSHTDRRGGPWGNKDFGPGEGHMIKHDVHDHNSRNIHKGHAHVSGLPDYYILTGDKRSLGVIKEVGNWWAKAIPVFFPTPVGNEHWGEAERDFGWPLFVMNEVFRATGDTKYLQAAAQEVNHLIQWWQMPSEHWVNGTVVGQNDWTQGTGWWHMYPRQDNSPWPSEYKQGKLLYNGTNPWMAGSVLASLIKFYETDKDYSYVDASLIKEMLLQTMNFVVKFGWEENLKSHPYFVYSEASRNTDGGSTHLMYALAYLWKLYDNGEGTNSQWYDTAPKWRAIAEAAYDDWKVVRSRGSSSLGFYGYETILHSGEFFKIMKELEGGPSTPDTTPPSTPQNLSGIAVSESQIDLNWSAAIDLESSVSTYNIYRDGVKINQTSSLQFSNTGLTSGASHTYEVSAVNSTGLESSKSFSATVSTLTDILPPGIMSVIAGSNGNTVDITYSEQVELISATTLSNYKINNSISVVDAYLGVDQKTVTLVTSPHSEGVSYTLSISNVRDLSNSANAIPVGTQITYRYVMPLVISNLSVESGETYQVIYDSLNNGVLAYIDRTYMYSSVPSQLQGATYIKTSNNDKSSSSATFLSFDVDQDVTVYITYDNRQTDKPAWLSGFVDTGDDLATSIRSMSVLAKNFSAGKIILGGNQSPRMYTVIVTKLNLDILPAPIPVPNIDTEAPSMPMNLSAIAISSSQVDLNWSASTDNVGVTGYNIYRDGVLITNVLSVSHTDTGLTAGMAYSYRVAALDLMSNESGQSVSTSVTTMADFTPFAIQIEAENMGTKTTGGKKSDGSWNIWSNGYIEEAVDFPIDGSYSFEIRARGKNILNEWSKMELRVDQVVVGNFLVNSTSFGQYVSVKNVPAGLHNIAIAFTNDYYGSSGDRNLYVDKVNITLMSVSGGDVTPDLAPDPAPDPTPEPTPDPAPFVIQIEAENMGTKTTGGRKSDGSWNIWSNGYIEEAVDFPTDGRYTFEIRARGKNILNEWSKMELKVDQVVVDNFTVNSTSFGQYVSVKDVPAGLHNIAIAFTNDYYGTSGDRNLYVDKINITLMSGSGGDVTPPNPIPDPEPFTIQIEAENMETKTTGGRKSDGSWNIWSNGYIEETVDFPTSGSYSFEIRARGKKVLGEWSKMEVRVDQVAVDNFTVNSTSYGPYVSVSNVSAGMHKVAIAFTNDYYGSSGDRNLYVDKVVIQSAP